MKISGQRNFIGRVCFPDQPDCLLHRCHRTLVHRNRRYIEPFFFFQMPGKIPQKRQPILIISRSADIRFYKLQLIGCLIKILEWQIPGDHRIAIDLTINTQIHHKLNPFVKNGIIILPTTVQTFDPHYHRLEIIFRLSSPGFIHNTGGYRLLSRINQ